MSGYFFLGIDRISLELTANEDEPLGKERLFPVDEVFGLESGSTTVDVLGLINGLSADELLGLEFPSIPTNILLKSPKPTVSFALLLP